MQKVIFTIFLNLVFQFSARSQAAFFDPSFGTGGFIETDFGYPNVGGWTEMILQPDGKILVRYNQASHVIPQENRRIQIARFLPDGDVDTSFGSGGPVVLLDSVFQFGHGGIQQLNLLPDGKILTAFATYFPPMKWANHVLQFDGAGHPDPNFGTNGALHLENDVPCSAILRLPNGKILLGYNGDDVGFRAINANGTLPGGSEINWTWTDPEEELLHQLEVTSDNRVLVCGRVINHDKPGSDYDTFFGKFDAGGWAGGSFGEYGLLRHDISGDYDLATDFQVLPDGKILYIGTAQQKMYVGRLTAKGLPDSTFHAVGHLIFGDFFPNLVVFSSLTFSKVSADQTTVAAVQLGNFLPPALLRLKTDGLVDSSFNDGGAVFFPDNSYLTQQVLTLPDRRILVCGTRKVGAGAKFFIARLLPEADALAWFKDADGDGFGTAEVKFSVGQPTGFVSKSSDCDDSNAQIFPNAPEICNGVDDNCDGKTDEIPAVACLPQLVLQLGLDGTAQFDISQILIIDPTLPCWQADATFEINKNAFDCTQIGQQPVILTATSTLGGTNQCQTLVEVVDNQKPLAACHDSLKVVLDDTGFFILTPNLVDAGSSDNCQIASISVSPNQFSAADLGKNTVTLTVTDGSGNSSTCILEVEVQQLIGTSEVHFSKNDFQILPNPTAGNLQVKISKKLDFKNLHLEILDALGRVLISKNEPGGGDSFQLDVQNLAAGRYLLRLKLDGGSVVLDFEKI